MAFAGLLVGVPTVIAVGALLRNDSVRHKDFIILGAIAFVGTAASILAWPLLKGYVRATGTQGTNVSPDQVKARGPQLPAEASNVTYFSDYRHTVAVFTLNESACLRWMQREDWTLEEIEYLPENVSMTESGVEHDVSDGFRAHKFSRPGGPGASIVYDRSQQKCYFEYVAW
jgi:hypothetical protein